MLVEIEFRPARSSGLRPRGIFGPGNPQLPLPPMLMFDRITRIADEGGSRQGRDRGRTRREVRTSGSSNAISRAIR